MKKSIIISLLSAAVLPMQACGWFDTHNSYLFSAYNHQEYSERVERICDENWKAYLGSTDEYFWFNADDIIKAARQKGDALMVGYVENLRKYLDCVDVERDKQHEWNYPSKEQIAQQQRDLQAIRTYALGKTKSKLRSQHALLYMRCNMMLGRHQENVTYWEQTARDFINTVYKEMMQNIYAGALYKTGREAEAAELFVEMGDCNSLMTQFYKRRSYQAIRQYYQQNPVSKVLPFLLQDFVNNAQEAHDAGEGNFGGKLFIRDINKQEAWQMRNLCEEVLRDRKTDVPCLWKTAKAWLEYMFGDKQQAMKDILQATQLDGTVRMKECARVIMLYLTADQAKDGTAFDDYLADELQWLDDKQQEPGNDGYYYRAKDRLLHRMLIDRYANRPVTALALLGKAQDPSYYPYTDTMRVEQLEKYLTFTNTPAKSTLDKYLKANIEKNDTVLEDLIGTKYMRLCQWDKAIQWLQHVPVSYYDQCGYRLYALVRKIEVEPWITRQWLTDEDADKAQQYNWHIRENLKLNFAKDMQMKEATLNILSGKALEQRCYDLAVRYAQANYRGDCWWLMRDSKSILDTVRVNETDLIAKAMEYLQQAAMSSDVSLKKKALFAMGWPEFYSEGNYWREDVWNSESGEFEKRVNRQSPQYRAYEGLVNITGLDPQENDYVTKCDEFLQFRTYYKTHR